MQVVLAYEFRADPDFWQLKTNLTISTFWRHSLLYVIFEVQNYHQTKVILAYYCHSGSLTKIMGEKNWQPINTRKFGNHVTHVRPYTPTCKPKWDFAFKHPFVFVMNRMATWTYRKKKQQQGESFFRLNFDVYTDMDNRERASARKESKGDEFRWKKDENFLVAVRKWEMLAASKVKNERQWKKKGEQSLQAGLHCKFRTCLH